MARFYFHLHECGKVLTDEDGTYHADLESARDAAVRAARDIMCSEVAEGRLCLSCRIDVLDEQGSDVLNVPFREAVIVTGL